MAHTDPAMTRAQRIVTTARDFWYHLMVFVLVNALLVGIDLSGGPNDGMFGLDFANWVIWSWGFGLLGHAIYVFAGDRRMAKVSRQERDREPANH